MQKVAITWDAAVMSKPVSRVTPPVRPPRPATMLRSARSLMSMDRRIATLRGSMSCVPKCSALSTIAASRLFASAMAAKSPVKWRLISSPGVTWAFPPPTAPPLMPKTGPMDGSRRASTGRLPIRERPSARPIDVVVFPSPAGVGETAVTKTIRESRSGRPRR